MKRRSMGRQAEHGEINRPVQDRDGGRQKRDKQTPTGGFQPFSRIPQAFAIGLKPLDGHRFLHVDDHLERYRSEKRALFARQFDDVMMWEAGSLAAQTEAASRISGAMKDAGHTIDLAADDRDLPPLAKAALTVQDDLLILQPSSEGWRLTAACLCFPSSWNLAEKFGKPLEAIHAPVPHMEGKTNVRIRRIFDMLRPDQPLWRENWSLEGDDHLRHDRVETQRQANYRRDLPVEDLWLRAEYQTLHKLPETDAILFTVKILVHKLTDFAESADGRRQLQALGAELAALSPQGTAYKGLTGKVDEIRDWLAQFGA